MDDFDAAVSKDRILPYDYDRLSPKGGQRLDQIRWCIAGKRIRVRFVIQMIQRHL